MPITLKIGLMSDKVYKDDYIKSINIVLSESYNIKDNLIVHIHISKGNNVSLRGIYKNELDTQVIIEETPKIESNNGLLKLIEAVVNKYNSQIKCEHLWERPITGDGDQIPDGRAACGKCGMQSKNQLKPIANKTLVSSSLSKPYVAKYDWKKTYIQGGDSGVVFCRGKSYETSFIEVFPKIGKHSTFIRGEGASMREAEEAAMIKVKGAESCLEHEFSRKVSGSERTDGSGVCIKCNLFSSTALDPMTKCFLCNTPTKKKFGSKFVCLEDYYKMDIKDVIYEAQEKHNEMIKKYPEMDRDVSKYKTKWNIEWDFRIAKQLMTILTDEEFILHYSKITNMIGHIQYILKRAVYTEGNKISSKSNLPEEEDPALVSGVATKIIENSDLIKSHILGDEPLKNSYIIPKKYFKN
jgi:hypothetical protein